MTVLNRLDLRGVDDIVAHLPRPAIDGEGPVAAVTEILHDSPDPG